MGSDHARRVLGLVIGFGGIVTLVWPELRLRRQRPWLFGWRHRGADRVRRMGDRSSHARSAGAVMPAQKRAGDRRASRCCFGIALLGGVARAARDRKADVPPRTAGALYLIFVGAISGFSARLRPQAPAGSDGVAVCACESDHCRGSWRADPDEPSTPHVRRGDDRLHRVALVRTKAGRFRARLISPGLPNLQPDRVLYDPSSAHEAHQEQHDGHDRSTQMKFPACSRSTTPSSHRTIWMIAMVSNIVLLQFPN
jgi:hypothetical protein